MIDSPFKAIDHDPRLDATNWLPFCLGPLSPAQLMNINLPTSCLAAAAAAAASARQVSHLRPSPF